MKPVAAVLLGCIALSVEAAQPLGRLFFTPEQRAQLDAARQHGTRSQQTGSGDNRTALVVSGFVRRSDGRSTVWINNQPEAPRSVERDGSIVVTLPNDRRRVRVKVGQSVDLSSGTVDERYLRAPAVAEPVSDAAAPGTAPVFRLRRSRLEEADIGAAGDRP